MKKLLTALLVLLFVLNMGAGLALSLIHISTPIPTRSCCPPSMRDSMR